MTGKTRKMRVIDSKKVITFPKEQERQQEEILSYFFKKAYNANSKSV